MFIRVIVGEILRIELAQALLRLTCQRCIQQLIERISQLECPRREGEQLRLEVDTSGATGIADWNYIDYVKVVGSEILQPAALRHAAEAFPFSRGRSAFVHTQSAHTSVASASFGALETEKHSTQVDIQTVVAASFGSGRWTSTDSNRQQQTETDSRIKQGTH